MRKTKFFSLALALVLSLCLTISPVAFAAIDPTVCATIPYAEATTQALGQPIRITGTPTYSAATSNDTAVIFGFDTSEGVWYVAVNKNNFEAFKTAASTQEMILYGTYAGILDVNGMPILDIQQGTVQIGDTAKDISEWYAEGQKVLDEQAAQQVASAPSSGSSSAKQSSGLMTSVKMTGTMVWIPTNGGTKYHSNSICSKMKNPEKVDLAVAKANGFTACKRCYK